MDKATYNSEEMAEMASVVAIIENNLNVKPATDTEYTFELLCSLVIGAKTYAEDALASDLASAMFKLGVFASENGLSIDAYQLAEDLYNRFAE